MSNRLAPPTFTVLEDAPFGLKPAVQRFTGIVAENPRRAVWALSGFTDPSDILQLLGGGGGDHTKNSRIIAAAGALVASDYYDYIEVDPTTQAAIDKTVAIMQYPEFWPLPSCDIGAVALRVFASQMRDRPLT